jgi:hypothetical protein
MFIRSKNMGENKSEQPKKTPKLPLARDPKGSQKAQKMLDLPEIKKKPKESSE